ncbi:DUF1178 family protein [Rhodoferax saidenbachensis]|uniref:DUF1178 domain-containing protein n=1 Tax=Rhodoferax saidenbachensis TaxID=1484693 RepID=A0ABU1ZQD2_9BURK|nr:DUF1178 family protein [Rhodoferax saidenbachensis]MDR7307754.1 hypothetical protein [Rhodoferax saidenbachensis]
MKVLDLHCAQGHPFEGWFASEDDFVSQCARALVQCPVCGDPSVVKKLSAPRLNLSGARAPTAEQAADQAPSSIPTGSAVATTPHNAALAAAWMAMARHVVATTTDVGSQFAEEARKMHYGEAEERGIRGRTTEKEARELAEEGIDVMPFVLPEALKEPLQ